MVAILDRYIGRVFIAYFLICMIGGVGLFTIVDVGARLGSFAHGRGLVGMSLTVVKYSLWNIPLVISFIFPPMLLVAAGWAMVQMAKNNELIAIKASGVSVYRIIVPLFVGGTVAGLMVTGMREWLIPRIAPQITEASNIKGDRFTQKGVFGYVRDGNWGYHVGAYDSAKKEMTHPYFFVFADQGIKETIEAVRGKWENGAWHLYDVVITPGNVGSDRRAANSEENNDDVVTVLDEYALPFKLMPDEMASQQVESSLMSTWQLRDLIKRQPRNARLRVDLHSRFTYPFTGIILLLIGLPFVVGFERVSRSKVLGLGMCFVVCGGFYAVTFLCNSLGTNNSLPMPWLAAWLPIILFTAVGVYLFDMIKT